MAAFFQRNGHSTRAWGGRIVAVGRGFGGAEPPTGLKACGGLGAVMGDDQAGRAMALGGKGQPAQGGGRGIVQLKDDSGQAARPQPLLRGPQAILGARGLNQDQPIHRQPGPRQARRIRPAKFGHSQPRHTP